MIIRIFGADKVYETHRAVWHFFKYIKPKYNFKIINYQKSKYENTFLFFEIESDDKNLLELIGTHLWVCTSPFRKNTKRKNWYFRIVCYELNNDIELFENNVKFMTMRSPKKGGQNVNKRDTGVRARYEEMNIEAVCFDFRNQLKNKQTALNRLYEKFIKIKSDNALSFSNFIWKENLKIKESTPIKIYKGKNFKETLNENTF